MQVRYRSSCSPKSRPAVTDNSPADSPCCGQILTANSEIHWEKLKPNLRHALALASNLGSTYAKAAPRVRGRMNQAISEEILIEVDGSVVYVRITQPFAAFHDEEFRA